SRRRVRKRTNSTPWVTRLRVERRRRSLLLPSSVRRRRTVWPAASAVRRSSLMRMTSKRVRVYFFSFFFPFSLVYISLVFLQDLVSFRSFLWGLTNGAFHLGLGLGGRQVNV